MRKKEILSAFQMMNIIIAHKIPSDSLGVLASIFFSVKEKTKTKKIKENIKPMKQNMFRVQGTYAVLYINMNGQEL